jgi:L-fuconolactonase
MNDVSTVSSVVINAHHHLWHYSAEEYDWINDDMAVLRRNFLPDDLMTELASAKVDGVVTVQARQTLEETSVAPAKRLRSSDSDVIVSFN